MNKASSEPISATGELSPQRRLSDNTIYKLKIGHKSKRATSKRLPVLKSNNTNTLEEKEKEVFRERNLIKKVKIFSFNILIYLLQTCVENPKVFSIYNIKNKIKRKIFRAFKIDISKIRNFLLLATPLHVILTKFTNISFKKSRVLEAKKNFYNFLLNMTWEDLLIFCKRKSFQFYYSNQTNVKKNRFIVRNLKLSYYNDYLKYVKDSDYLYSSRLDVDRNYLKVYQQIEAEKESYELYNFNFSDEVLSLVINKTVDIEICDK